MSSLLNYANFLTVTVLKHENEVASVIGEKYLVDVLLNFEIICSIIGATARDVNKPQVCTDYYGTGHSEIYGTICIMNRRRCRKAQRRRIFIILVKILTRWRTLSSKPSNNTTAD